MFFEDEVFWQALWNTLGIIGSAPIGIAIALGLALLVNADIRGREVYRTVIFLSYPLMTVAVAIIWRWMFDERVGLINYVARVLHLVDKPIPFLNSFTWALPSVIAANIWQMLGFYMIIILTGLQHIPGNLYEAAEIDGANAFHRFLRITFPLLKPSIFLCFVIGMLNLGDQLRPGLCDDRRRPRACHRDSGDLHLQARLQPDPIRLCGGRHRGLFPAAARRHLDGRIASPAAMPAPWSVTDETISALADPSRPARRQRRHAGAVLLGAEDVRVRREHLHLPAEHHSARGPTRSITWMSGMRSRSRASSQQRDRLGDDDRRQCAC